ncbi:MAG: thiamine pyrophosphate-dependent enzyme, partial [Gaiellaceae bacterium]
DVLSAAVEVGDAPRVRTARPIPSPTAVAELEQLLAGAERPLAILGGAGWTTRTTELMTPFLAANDLPAGAAFRRQDTLDNDDPRYVGDVGIGINPKLAQRVRDADVLLVVGPRLGEATTSGYTLLDVPAPAQTLVHVHPGAEELGRVYQPALPILASPEAFAVAVSGMRVTPRWGAWAADARADYEAWQRHDPMVGDLDLGDCIAHLRERVPDAIVTNGAGNHTVWIHRFWRFHSFPSQLAPTSGAMGYGLPAAIAAKLVSPDRTVICFSGDGDFLMLGQELATAMQYDAPIVVLIVDNGMYGTIRMHQERNFPRRVVGTDLVNPDFAAYAESFGAYGENVGQTAEFPAALERALDAGRPAVLALKTNPETITPRATITAIRAAAG